MAEPERSIKGEHEAIRAGLADMLERMGLQVRGFILLLHQPKGFSVITRGEVNAVTLWGMAQVLHRAGNQLADEMERKGGGSLEEVR